MLSILKMEESESEMVRLVEEQGPVFLAEPQSVWKAVEVNKLVVEPDQFVPSDTF